MTLRISQTFFESIFAHIYNDLQKHKCDQKKKPLRKMKNMYLFAVNIYSVYINIY